MYVLFKIYIYMQIVYFNIFQRRKPGVKSFVEFKYNLNKFIVTLNTCLSVPLSYRIVIFYSVFDKSVFNENFANRIPKRIFAWLK